MCPLTYSAIKWFGVSQEIIDIEFAYIAPIFIGILLLADFSSFWTTSN
jgi:hypothetical protein